MSEAKLTKKQQKAAQFKATKKGKSAALEDHPATPDDLPEDIPSEPKPEASTSTNKAKESRTKKDKADAPQSAAPEAAPVKAEKRSHKRKRLAAEAEAGIVSSEPAPTPSSSKQPSEAATLAAKTKKSKKAAAPEPNATKTTFGDDGEVAATQAVESTPPVAAPAESAKGNKFILFIGNMAFTTTTETISKHFGQTCGEVPSVRLLTRKADPDALANLPASKQKSIAKGKAQDPSKPQSRGCAFVEFKSSEALRKALKFHHTMLEGRKINVELTAGGGGKSEKRMEKIKEKNVGLEKERAKLHGKYVAPKNEARKQAREGQGQGQGQGRERKREREEEGAEAKETGWSRNSGRERKMPRFMATGANAVRVAPTS